MDEIKEHYGTERAAKDRYRYLGSRQEIPFRGKLLTVTYYRENTDAALCWCVKYTVEPPRHAYR
jgi:hypothetical protein